MEIQITRRAGYIMKIKNASRSGAPPALFFERRPPAGNPGAQKNFLSTPPSRKFQVEIASV